MLNEPQNPTPEENSIPPSPQEPMTDIPVPATDLATPEVPLEAPEAPRGDFSVKSNDIPPPVSTPETIENKAGIEEISKPENIPENQAQAPETVENIGEIQSEPKKALENNIPVEPVPSEAIPPSSAETASADAKALADRQISANEPTAQVPENEPLKPEQPKEEIKITEPTPPPSEIKTEPKQEEVKPVPIPIIIPKKNLARELLIKARNAIQFRKRKKLDKVMTLFLKKSKITNDEVEKFMHVSDATATRYLNTLKKENKIKQTGETGKSVFYSKYDRSNS